MKTRRWSILGRIMLATALSVAMLQTPIAQAAPRKTKLVTSAYESAVCTNGGSSTGAADSAGEGDRTLGTSIHWMASPDAAWRAAADEGKLVFMIQVSGNFARQEFT